MQPLCGCCYRGPATTARLTSEPDRVHLLPADLECTDKQGAHGSHGLHFLVTHDSDNAFVGSPVPVNEIDGTQWQFAVPTAAPTNVGEPYGNVVRARVQPVVVPIG